MPFHNMHEGSQKKMQGLTNLFLRARNFICEPSEC